MLPTLLLAAIPRAQVLSLTLSLSVAAIGLVAILAVMARVPLVYNLRNLRVRWLTNGLTVLAFVLVVGLLTMMNAFVNGMYKLTEQSGHADNVIILGRGMPEEVFSTLGFGDAGDIGTQPGVARDANNAPLVSRETYLIVNQPIVPKPTSGPVRRFLQVRGVQDPLLAAQVHEVELHDGGTWFSTAGVRRSGDESTTNQTALIEAVIGEGLARTLGHDRSPEERAEAANPERLDVGDLFVVGERQFVVTGVMQSAGLTFDSEIWAKHAIIGKMFGKETFTTVVLKAESPAEAKRLAVYFADDYSKAQLQPYVETVYFSNLNGTSAQMQNSILIVAAFVALGGVFGIVNTMFAAISQRTKDIGVMRLLGFSRRQILISFLLESLLVALVGGVLGCLVGYVVSQIWFSSVTSTVGSGPGGGKSVVLKVTFDLNIIAQGMLLALVMGAIGGIIPTLLSGLRLKPLEALR